MFIFIIFFLISLCGKTRENFYRSIALNILNTIKTFNTTNRTSRFLFEDHCNSSKNPSLEIRNYIPKIILFKLHIFALLFFFIYFSCSWKYGKTIIYHMTYHAKTTYKNKMLEKERRNDSYRNTSGNENLFVLIFYFLQVSLDKRS